MQKQSGIYLITNTITSVCYVGSSANIWFRKGEHLRRLRRNDHHSSHMQRSFNIHGEAAFVWSILEEVLPDRILLFERESHWIRTLKPGYNQSVVSASALGSKRSPEAIERSRQGNLGKTMSLEAREKIRQAHLGICPSPETLEKLRQSHLGQKPTPETLEKNRQAHLGRTLSPEAREKIRQSKLGKKRSPELREKLRQANLGKKQTPEHIQKRTQRPVSDETKQKLRDARIAADNAGKPHGGPLKQQPLF